MNIFVITKIYKRSSISIILAGVSLLFMTVFPPLLAQNSHLHGSVPHSGKIPEKGEEVGSNDYSMGKDHREDQDHKQPEKWTKLPIELLDPVFEHHIKKWVSQEEGHGYYKISELFINYAENSSKVMLDVYIQFPDQSFRRFRFLENGKLVGIWKGNPDYREWTQLPIRDSENGEKIDDKISDKISGKEDGKNQHGRDGSISHSTEPDALPKKAHPRSIRIAVYADPSYRVGHPEWREDIRMFIHEMNDRFYGELGIGIEIAHVHKLFKTLYPNSDNLYDFMSTPLPTPAHSAHIKVLFTQSHDPREPHHRLGIAEVGKLGRLGGESRKPLATIVRAGHPSRMKTGRRYTSWSYDVHILQHELTHNLGERHVAESECGPGSYANLMCPYLKWKKRYLHWSSDQIQRMKVMAEEWLTKPLTLTQNSDSEQDRRNVEISELSTNSRFYRGK